MHCKHVFFSLHSHHPIALPGHSFRTLFGGRLQLYQAQLCQTLCTSSCRFSHDHHKGKRLDKTESESHILVDLLPYFNLHFLGFLCVHFDSSSFAFSTGSDVALNCKGKKKVQDLSKSTNALLCFSCIAFIRFQM